jgi:hypothetical protein
MKKVAIVAAALVVAAIFFLLATLPPHPVHLSAIVDPDRWHRTVAGAYHIHSNRSDGAADKDAIAAAAARAGLAFIILTDHGDGTRQPDPPVYLHGVLCLDAVEISTNGGHYVAIDMQPASYPLGGEPDAVVEDVKRLGGFGIVAHPDSPRPQLAWGDWDAPFDGIEWLSADSEWRDESRLRLTRALFQYFLRPAPALASLLDRPVATLAHWDALTAKRRVVGLAGVDAHGGIGRGVEEGGKRRAALGHVPSYEASFRTFTTRAILDRPFSADAETDARSLITSIRNGRVFTVIDALADAGFVDLEQDASGEYSLTYAIPDGAALIMVKDGHDSSPLQEGPAGRRRLSSEDTAASAARFEVRVPYGPGTPPAPWLVTNPTYFRPPPSDRPLPAGVTGAAQRLPADTLWHSEHDSRSLARLQNLGGQVTLDYTLGAGDRNSQFAAAVADIRGRAPRFSGILFSATASRPGRISVQLRYGELRWAHSVYVDASVREVRLAVDRLVPADFQTGPPPGTSTADSLLFVADLTNSRPGDSNTVRISNLKFEK